MVPQIVNAVLSRHNFILLGLRGQAKTRLIRMLVTLLDRARALHRGLRNSRQSVRAHLPQPAANLIAEKGDETPIAWLRREERYVEKLATPDVTIADMIGDIDPIKAARTGQNISDELTVHYGLLPRANRGIFAINELPDLAGKIQVGLFNIMQEGDVQIKGYPVRLPLDVMLVFTANPEDYTARGKIITPLKDRIGSEIRTHYPRDAGAWHGDHRAGSLDRSRQLAPWNCAFPITFARWWSSSRFRLAKTRGWTSDRASASACRFRCWKTSRRMPSGARLMTGEAGRGAARAGCLRGAAVDHRQARTGIRRRAEGRRHGGARTDPAGGRQSVHRTISTARIMTPIVQWFELGGSLKLDETATSAKMVQELGRIQGLMEKTEALWAWARASRMRCARARLSSFWKACTRIAASAAMKRRDSWPRLAAASSRRTIEARSQEPVSVEDIIQ